MKIPRNTVTAKIVGKNDSWSVGTTSGGSIEGVILTVFRSDMLFREKGVYAVNRQFPDKESAYQFAWDHGYLQQSVTPWCPAHRVRHYNVYSYPIHKNTVKNHRHPSAWCAKLHEFTWNQEQILAKRGTETYV